MTVNILGCLLIGMVYGLAENNISISPALKLLLTVGFCGGFTTFSTFMNESLSLLRADSAAMMAFMSEAAWRWDCWPCLPDCK